MHKEMASSGNSTSSIDYETVGPAYTSPGIASCPPLVQLQAYGLCCPFFETEDSQEARIGAQILSNYPITWYRKQVTEGVSSDGEKNATNNQGFIDGLVTAISKSSQYCGIPATLSIVDTEQCGPLIKVIATCGGKDDKNTTRLPSISIPLHLVDSVSAGWSLVGDNTEGGIKLFARKQQSNGLLGVTTSGEELLRFDTLGGGGDDWSEAVLPAKVTEPNEHADRIIARLRALIAWNRKRMAAEVQQGKIVTPSNFIAIS